MSMAWAVTHTFLLMLAVTIIAVTNWWYVIITGNANEWNENLDFVCMMVVFVGSFVLASWGVMVNYGLENPCEVIGC